ncbi:hypothetical protein [Streptomyces sp. NPDC046870]|uniref:hypothetical protein n=1 Tax=Streptomyces sp. NPDC046870 TaxID=3155135 RepID=UPI003453B876
MPEANRAKKAGYSMAWRTLAATAAVVALGTITGCSEPHAKTEYDAPRALCGTPVNPDLVSPFLPSGKEIKVRETHPVPSRTICRVDVDGRWVLMANTEWWREDVSSSTVASANAQLRKAQLSPDGDYYSATGSVKLVKGCKSSAHSRQLLYTSLQISNADLGDTPAMKKLATAYTDAVGRSDACS